MELSEKQVSNILRAGTILPMDALHAPWRIQYVLGPKRIGSDVSLFTEVGQSSDDDGNYVILRGKSCFAMLNAYPYSGGHLMVIPYRQIPDWNGLVDLELLELLQVVRHCQNALTRVMKPDAFNVGVNIGQAAGAGIAEHLHIHVVPRWKGDTNFMPVIAQTTTIPEALRETAANLRAEVANNLYR